MRTNSQSDWKLNWKLRIRHKETATFNKYQILLGLEHSSEQQNGWSYYLKRRFEPQRGEKFSVPFQTELSGPPSPLKNGHGTYFPRTKRTGPVVDHPPSFSYNSTGCVTGNGCFWNGCYGAGRGVEAWVGGNEPRQAMPFQLTSCHSGRQSIVCSHTTVS